MVYWLDDSLPVIPADILERLESKGDPGDPGDSPLSAVARVVGINQQLHARVMDLERRLHESETFREEMHKQIIGLVQINRRLGYEASHKPPAYRQPSIGARNAT